MANRNGDTNSSCSVECRQEGKLLDEVHAELEGDETAALAETVIPTRAATRRVFGTKPSSTKVWDSLAREVVAAFED